MTMQGQANPACVPAGARWLALLACLTLAQANAQPTAPALRDPTVAPPVAGGMTAGPASGLQPGALSVIVRDGKPYLVVGTRLYAQGQQVGQARIEKITETEVWLREGGGLRKLPVFAGVLRRESAPIANKSFP